MAIVQEIYNGPHGFWHRLVDTDTGNKSFWTPYSGIARLGEYRGRIPEYWGVNEKDTPPVYKEVVEAGVEVRFVTVLD